MNIRLRQVAVALPVGILYLVLSLQSSDARQQGKPEPVSSTVPLHVAFNRPFIDLDFNRPDGSPRKARFWVDTGGGAFIFCEPLARDLGMKFGDEANEGGERIAPTTAPATSLGTMPLNVEATRAFIVVGKKSIS